MELCNTRKSVVEIEDARIDAATTHIKYEQDYWSLDKRDGTRRGTPLYIGKTTDIGLKACVQDFTPGGENPEAFEPTPEEAEEKKPSPPSGKDVTCY